MSRSLLGVLIAANLLAAGYVVIDQIGEPAAVAIGVTTTTEAATSSTVATTTSSTTTTIPPTTTTVAAALPTDRRAVFTGLGTWVDVFDFSPAYMQEGEPTPVVTPDDLDAMAAAGVRTLYLQASRDDERTPGLLESPDTVARFLVAAHERGISVVAWYLPKQYDDADLARLRAILDFDIGGHRFDGVGLDIEFRGAVTDVAERNARLVDLSRRLRDEVGDRPLAAIVPPPVVMDIVNPNFWPSFPWTEIAPFYDVWMPMAYWTNRKSTSEWRDARRYTEANVQLVREHLGDPSAPVHVIGGIGDTSSDADYEGFVAGAHATGSIGASVYDWRTTAPAAWPILRGVPGA